jgi:hypothetical protein
MLPPFADVSMIPKTEFVKNTGAERLGLSGVPISIPSVAKS